MKKSFLYLILFVTFFPSFSQDSGGQQLSFFRGSVSVTNKGISTFPNLTLGKPAIIFDLAMGKGKLSFEPLLRWSLKGEPWSFLFWWRYRLVEKDKFRFTLGAHPAYTFKNMEVSPNGNNFEITRASQYLAGELAPTFLITKTISTGLYYIYSHGLGDDITRNSNFVSFRSNFSNIRLTEKVLLRLNTQLYYLKMDANDGFYVNGVVGLSKPNIPVSFSAGINQPIKTRKTAGNEFLWNKSLTWTFSNRYIKA